MMSPQPEVVSFIFFVRHGQESQGTSKWGKSTAWSLKDDSLLKIHLELPKKTRKDISTSLIFETQLWEVITAGSLVEIPSNASNRRAWCFTPTAGPWDDPPVPTLTQVSAIYTQVHICFKNKFLKNTEKKCCLFAKFEKSQSQPFPASVGSPAPTFGGRYRGSRRLFGTPPALLGEAGVELSTYQGDDNLT